MAQIFKRLPRLDAFAGGKSSSLLIIPPPLIIVERCFRNLYSITRAKLVLGITMTDRGAMSYSRAHALQTWDSYCFLRSPFSHVC